MIIMVNKVTSEHPINPKAAAAWDLRQKRKAAEKGDEQSKRLAIREVARASKIGGRESRGGIVESGLLGKPTGGIVSGLVDTGNKRKRGSGSWKAMARTVKADLKNASTGHYKCPKCSAEYFAQQRL